MTRPGAPTRGRGHAGLKLLQRAPLLHRAFFFPRASRGSIQKQRRWAIARESGGGGRTGLAGAGCRGGERPPG
eukprot:61259-Pyramimonas_sp.AAC.1